MLHFLGLDADPNVAPVWAHRLIGTDQDLFSAPLTNQSHLQVYMGSIKVCELAKFVWAQMPEVVPEKVTATPRYTLKFSKQACAALSCTLSERTPYLQEGTSRRFLVVAGG